MFAKLTQEVLKKVIKYNPKTGRFQRRRHDFPFKNKKRRSAVGAYSDKWGNRKVVVLGKQYMAHRVAFFYMEGKWPEEDVRHIDGNNRNNKWANLEKCSRTKSVVNRPLSKNNTSGYRGVSWAKTKGKYSAQITINYVHHYLGRFASKHDAARAYNKAASKAFGEFANLNIIKE